MKVTKSILKEMIESEIVNERIGQRVDLRGNAAQVSKLQAAVDNKDKSKFDRWWRNEFANIDQADIKDANHGAALKKAIKGAIALGWLPTGFLSGLSAGRTSAGLSVPEEKVTPVQTSKASKSDISILDYLLKGGSVLKFGSSGSKVLALQNILNARLQSHGKQDKLIEVTGTFDSATKKAVETMQGVYDIQVDGIVGRQTWLALKTDGAEKAAVTSRAGAAPASGKADTAEEEAAAIAAAKVAAKVAAKSDERPEKPGPMFLWDSQKLVWYADHNHYYKDETPEAPIYQLWIVKDDEDFHIKMETGDTWANVTQSDIDSLETAAMKEPVKEVDPVPLDAGPAPTNESYSLASVMLLEFSPATTRTNNHPENTERDEVGRGDPILTLEEQEEAITKRLSTFTNSIQKFGRILKIEADKPFYQDSDEKGAMQALKAFDQLASQLYDEMSDKILDYSKSGGDITKLKTPSQMLARSGGWASPEDMIGTETSDGLDSFFSREEFGTMSIIVKRNNFSLIEKARVVVASPDPGADPEEITRVNNELDVMMQAIKPIALIIAANSYDPNDTVGWRLAQTAAAAALVAGVVFAAPVVAGAVGTGVAAGGAASATGAGILASTATGLGAGTTALGGAAMTSVGLAGAGAAATTAAATTAGVAGGSTAAGLAAGTAALGTGIGGAMKAGSFLGDGADEDAVIKQLELFSDIALQFYQNNAKSIVDNQINVKTPSQYLLDIYNKNVNEDDVAATIDGLVEEMDEFLEGGNLTTMTAILEMNNVPYSQFDTDMNESFSFDRFTKLAGLLKS
jgi:peptidoglycan hydrolase-like protein with peptidoglycan-binding domain